MCLSILLLLGWNTSYAALLEYCKEHGTCNVHYNAIYECDLEGLGENGDVYHYLGNLGTWLHRQRTAKKGVNNRKIKPEREALLQKLVDEGKSVYVCVCFISSCKFIYCHDYFMLLYCCKYTV